MIFVTSTGRVIVARADDPKFRASRMIHEIGSQVIVGMVSGFEDRSVELKGLGC